MMLIKGVTWGAAGASAPNMFSTYGMFLCHGVEERWIKYWGRCGVRGCMDINHLALELDI